MAKITLDDTLIQQHLYPFTLGRSAAGIRVGILTIREKWEALLGQKVRVNADDDFSSNTGEQYNPLIFSANIIPTKQWVADMGIQPAEGQEPAYKVLAHPWDINRFNDWAIREDFALITNGRASQPIPQSVQCINPEGIFIEEGAKLGHCLLNAENGPIYIGKNTEVMEGATIRGPFALCEGSVVKMGARIYGATTIGPYSVVGGEIKNSVIFGYSNKAHDGYLGDAVLGEWCNLGAGTSCSNVKNNAGLVKVWSEAKGDYIEAGLKCGLLMGDYSRAAINTSFNTGTVVGVCCNVAIEGLSPRHIRSFTWKVSGNEKYRFEKALSDVRNWKKLKNQALSEKEIQRLQHIFEQIN